LKDVEDEVCVVSAARERLCRAAHGGRQLGRVQAELLIGARCVDAPYSASFATRISPIESRRTMSNRTRRWIVRLAYAM
jgi:hypothetical protein